jgi:hypothetical protein
VKWAVRASYAHFPVVPIIFTAKAPLTGSLSLKASF